MLGYNFYAIMPGRLVQFAIMIPIYCVLTCLLYFSPLTAMVVENAAPAVLKNPETGYIQGGDNVLAFRGTLDGGDFTVTVPYEGHPLFGYVWGATIRNLNIYGEKIAGYGLVDNLEGVYSFFAPRQHPGKLSHFFQALHLQNSYKSVTIVTTLQGKTTKEATFMFCFSNFDCSALLQMLCQCFGLGC